ncbi:MAG: hypothetical protein MZU97_02865 [Bacillus subtilis]|nr:hypothetical protein [Bacillus subtilis]
MPAGTDLLNLPAHEAGHAEICSHAGISWRQFAGICLLIGLFVAVEAASINVAYTLQIVPYVIAIKRLSIIFMVLYGTLVFSEEEIKKRILGIALMVAGAIIILVFT